MERDTAVGSLALGYHREREAQALGMEKQMSRKDIKDRHERYVVDEFLRFWESQHHEHFEVVERPDPPEAVVESPQRRTWIEVGTVYASDAWAKALHSYSNPDEEHKPMPPGPYVNMDLTFAERFLTVLRDKLTKTSYGPVFKALGPGILVLDTKTPWFGRDTWEMTVNECLKADWSNYTRFFCQVFIAYRHMNATAFEEWKECPTIANLGLHGARGRTSASITQ